MQPWSNAQANVDYFNRTGNEKRRINLQRPRQRLQMPSLQRAGSAQAKKAEADLASAKTALAQAQAQAEAGISGNIKQHCRLWKMQRQHLLQHRQYRQKSRMQWKLLRQHLLQAQNKVVEC